MNKLQKPKKSKKRPPSLRKLQSEIIKSLTQKKMTSSARQFVKGGAHDEDFRMARYRNSLWEKQRREIAYVFEVTLKLLPDDLASKITDSYIQTHPSSSYTLADATAAFPGFLKKKIKDRKVPFLLDMALLEWDLFKYSQHALPKAHKKTQTKNLLELSPNVKIIQLNWPLFSIWKSATRQKRFNPKSIKPKVQWLAVTQYETGISVEPLTTIEAQFLNDYVLSKTANSVLLSAGSKRILKQLKERSIL